MGHFGRITSLADLPDEKTFVGYVRKAVALKDAGVKNPRVETENKTSRARGSRLLRDALRNNKKAQQTFDNIQPQPS